MVERFNSGLEHTRKVLEQGFVTLEDFMGGDAAVVRAARISYMSEAGTPAQDACLIRRLLEGGHNTPFEHAVFRWAVKCPIFIARQWMRHRIGTFNEKSLRYCIAERECYAPEGTQNSVYKTAYAQAFEQYDKLLTAGVRPEQARIVLPVATYTEFVWTVNAWSLINFLEKRNERHAQFEMRKYAQAIHEIFAIVMPQTAEAFM